MQSQTLYVSTRGPTSGSGMNLKKTIAAIAAASMSVSAFMVSAENSSMNAEEKMIGKPQSATFAAAKKQLATDERDAGWGKRMTAEQPELAGLRKTTERTPLACLEKIGSAMRKARPVALAMTVSA